MMRKSIVNQDGSVDWNAFENLILCYPDREFSEIFAPFELKAIYSRQNSSEYYKHFGNVMIRKRNKGGIPCPMKTNE